VAVKLDSDLNKFVTTYIEVLKLNGKLYLLAEQVDASKISYDRTDLNIIKRQVESILHEALPIHIPAKEE